MLGVTKATAGEVNARLAAASEARRRISDACEEYRPVAHRAQLLYFLIAQFSTVNAMYQTSLAQVEGYLHLKLHLGPEGVSENACLLSAAPCCSACGCVNTAWGSAMVTRSTMVQRTLTCSRDGPFCAMHCASHPKVARFCWFSVKA